MLIIGDSLSAAYGFDQRHGWPALLQERLRLKGYPHQVINASISGDTSSGALARLPQALKRYQPKVVVIEIGGNDGLQALPLKMLGENLRQLVMQSRRAGASVLLLGMRLPPNYGPRYTASFSALYTQTARRFGIPLVPFFLDGVAGRQDLMQIDGIHPREQAQPYLVDNVWPYLIPLLRAPVKKA